MISKKDQDKKGTKKMVKTSTELNLKVKKARLLTRQEFMDYGDNIPKLPYGGCWWLADVDDDDNVAYAEGDYTEEDMFCLKDEPNTMLRVALEIECDNIKARDEFVYLGYVFTALSSELAISNNFLGYAYYDENNIPDYTDLESAGYGPDCTIDNMLYSLSAE